MGPRSMGTTMRRWKLLLVCCVAALFLAGCPAHDPMAQTDALDSTQPGDEDNPGIEVPAHETPVAEEEDIGPGEPLPEGTTPEPDPSSIGQPVMPPEGKEAGPNAGPDPAASDGVKPPDSY